MKICSRCFQNKEFSEFYRQENGQFGLTSECKECRKLRVKLGRERNQEKEKERHKRYYQEKTKSKKLNGKKY
jgi:hypothetical protein